MAYQIRVNCTCGKVLKIPEQYAGKRGRCPNCGKKIAIPSMDEIQQKENTHKEETAADVEMRQCPTCGAYLNPGDKICVSCHTNVVTGEWPVDNQAAEKKRLSPLLFAGSAFILVVVVAVVLLQQGMFSSAKKTPQPLLPMPVDNAAVSMWGNEVKKLLEMPDTTAESLERKIQEFEAFLEKPFKSPVMKEYASLLQKRREFQGIKAYQGLAVQQNLSPIAQWLRLKELTAAYQDTQYAAKMDEELKNLENQVLALARTKTQEADEMMTAQKYAQLINQTLRWLHDVTKASCPSEALQQELKAHVRICLEAIDKPVANMAKNEPTPKSAEEEKLQALKSRFNDFLATYYQGIREWEFAKMFAMITPFAEEAITLKARFPEDPDISKLLGLYEEAKLLKKFWQFADQGIKSLEGKTNAPWFLKKRKPVEGKLTKYQDEKATVLNPTTNQSETVDLRDFTPTSIGRLTLANNKETPELLLATSCFYYVTREITECRDLANKAMKIGASPEDAEKFKKWAEGTLDEMAKSLKERDELAKKDKQQQDENMAESKRERSVREARRIIKKLLQEYREGNNERIFGYLEEVKDAVSRDELIKINKAVKKEEGQSLTKIAETVFEHCTFCRNSAKIKCATCRGEGIIQSDPRLIGSTPLPTKKAVCQRCKGTGEIDCEICYEKRHNRKYIMLVDYYKDL